jgi:hypothetical protein
VVPLHLLITFLVGWLQHEQHQVIQYLREENQILKLRLRTRRVRFTDDERRRLAASGAVLGRRLLARSRRSSRPTALARAARRSKVDILEAPAWPAQHAPGDSPSRRADGDRESDVGLHPHARRLEESVSRIVGQCAVSSHAQGRLFYGMLQRF